MIAIFSIITTLIISLFILFSIKRIEIGQILTGVLGIFAIGIMWLGLGLSVVETTENERLENVDIFKSEYVVYIENSGENIKEFHTKKEYEEINDGYNMYGSQVYKKIFYKNKN